MQRSAPSATDNRLAERQFRIIYFSGSFLVETLALVFILIGQTLSLFNGQETSVCSGGYSVWGTMLVPVSLVVAVFQGRERYTVDYRGPLAVCWQLLYASGLAVSLKMRPGCCSWCDWLWQHRTLFLNLATIISPPPAAVFMYGGVMGWLLATMVDFADPAGGCEQSLGCLLAALQQLIARSAAPGPASFGASLLLGLISKSSRSHLADVLLPALPIFYFERKARAAWAATLHQQQELGQSAMLSAMRWRSTAFMGKSSTSKSPQPAGPPHPSGSNDAAGNSNDAASVTAQDAVGSLEVSAEVHSPAGPAPNSSQTALSVGRLAAARIQRGQQQAVNAATAAGKHKMMQEVLAARYIAGQPLYVSPMQSRTVSFKFHEGPSAAPAQRLALEQQLRTALLVHLDNLAHGAHAVTLSGDSTRGQPNAETGNSRRLKWHAVQCFGFPGCWQVFARLAALRPCWKAETAGLSRDEGLPPEQHCSQIGQPLQQDPSQWRRVAENVLQAWPGWTVAEVQELHGGDATWAMDAAATLPSSPAAATQAIVHLQPVALLLQPDELAPHADVRSHAGEPSLHVAAAGAGTTAKMELCLPGSMVQQLRASGHPSVRVVLAEPLQGVLLLDQAWQLAPAQVDEATAVLESHPEEHIDSSCCEEASASAAAVSAALASVPEPLDDIILTIDTGSVLADMQQQQLVTAGHAAALSVVVMAGSHAEGATGDPSAPAAGRSSITPLHGVVASPRTVHRSAAVPLVATDKDLAGKAGPRPGTVLAHLPLLVLPAMAYEEVLQLSQAAGAACQDHARSYQQLLPVLQDWACAIMWSGPGNTAAQSSEDAMQTSCSSSAKGVFLEDVEELYAALMSFLEGLGMVQCCKLLSQQRWKQRQLAVAAAGSSAPGASGKTAPQQDAELSRQQVEEEQPRADVSDGPMGAAPPCPALVSGVASGLCCGLSAIMLNGDCSEAIASGSGASCADGLALMPLQQQQHCQGAGVLPSRMSLGVALAGGDDEATYRHVYQFCKASVLQRQDGLVTMCFLLIFACVLWRLFYSCGNDSWIKR